MGMIGSMDGYGFLQTTPEVELDYCRTWPSSGAGTGHEQEREWEKRNGRLERKEESVQRMD